jgi:hypothetical protein
VIRASCRPGGRVAVRQIPWRCDGAARGRLVTRSNAPDKAALTPLQDKPAPAIAGTTLDGKAFDLDVPRRLGGRTSPAGACRALQEHVPRVVRAVRNRWATTHLVSVVFGDTADNVVKLAENGGDCPS